MEVLLIDDHHLLVEVYRNILAESFPMLHFNITTASGCKEAVEIVENSSTNIDLALIDWHLPAFLKRNFLNGGDLALMVKSKFPNCKIAVITSAVEVFVLYSIKKKINPAVILVKSDMTRNVFIEGIEMLIRNEVYYSSSVSHSIKTLTSQYNYLDNYNRQIIFLLSKGFKTKSLPTYIPLSDSAISKRKAQIRDYFGLDKGSDEEIVTAARQAGFI